MLDIFKYRNFRLFFFGQSISLIGTWMQQLAIMWLVYRLTGSSFLLGLVGFCSQIPSFFLSPLAGVFTDRWNLRRTIIATQCLAMLQAAVLFVLTRTGVVALEHVLFLSVFMGLVNAFDIPARQAFLIQMVEGRENLAAAIGLNSSIFNGARLLGPAVAGFLIAAVGEATCFLLNALSYLAVLAALLAMRLPPPVPARPPQHVLHELREGIRYAFGFPPIREILHAPGRGKPGGHALDSAPADLCHGGAAWRTANAGALDVVAGHGIACGSPRSGLRKTVLGLGRQIAWASGAVGLALIQFSLSGVLWLSMSLLVLTGFALMMETAASNTVLQTIVDDDKRGRVMSFYAMAFLGVAPLGSLLAGSLASRLGVAHVVQLAGATCMVASLVFALRLPALRVFIRPIYRRIGILPDLTSGIPAEAECAAPDEEER